MQFEFTTVSKIIFGAGKINSIGDLASQYGLNVQIVSGVPVAILERLQNLLARHKGECSVVQVDHEPTIDYVNEALEYAHRISPDLVIGIGGGSALDTAKVIAALLTNPGEVIDYLEVIGRNMPLINSPVPLITIPTTSGTGSEVTKNAVIGSPAHKIKVSLRSQYLLPRIALIDPELTVTLPPTITAYTGLDALTQLIEPYTCNYPNPFTDALCLEGIRRVAQSFRKAFDDGSDLIARTDMALAALFSGIALANARLGAVHGLAGPIGGKISAHHGEICASLLPHVLVANLLAIRNREPRHPVLERYATIGKLLSGDSSGTIDSGIEWVRDFCQHAHIRPLSAFGLAEEMFEDIIKKAVLASSMKGNPILLNEIELRNILTESLES